MIRSALRAWRLDPTTAVVFPTLRDASAAAEALGPRCIAHFFVGAAMPSGVPEQLSEDASRVLAIPVTAKDSLALSACECAIVTLDPLLRAVSTMSGPVMQAIGGVPMALVCPWWPSGGALESHLRKSILGIRNLAVMSPLELPRVLAAERLNHPVEPLSELAARVAVGNKEAPARALAAVRAIAMRPSEMDVPSDALFVAESQSEVLRLRKALPAGTRILSIDAILSGSQEPAPCVVFAVEPLVEYTERLVASAVHAERIVTHTWTVDGDSARVDGWAPGPYPARAAEAMRAILAQLVV
jgi:hypothetical protein